MTATDNAAQVAGQAAHADERVTSACLAMSKQRTAATAGHRLVPTSPPALTSIEIAARCRPAPGQMAGGDWWDAVVLPSGRSGLIVGDVMGHDEHAAAAMTQLRAVAHALAELDLPPAEMLRRLDRTTAALAITTLATCIYAVIEPSCRHCVIAGAGHPPPVIATPDGMAVIADLPAGLPVGLGTAIYGQISLPFPPGAILSLYTDGLVETRTRSVEEGIDALRSALTGKKGPLGHLCDRILGELGACREDDTTLVLARSQPGRQRTPQLLPLL
jgi:serine phosphatase RsbU (regulator of sigma subunit)